MRTIFKYEVSFDEPTRLELPSPKFLHGDFQSSKPVVWVEIDSEGGFAEAHYVRVLGTGWEVPAGFHHLSTVQVGSFVWHFYTTQRRNIW